MKTFQSSLPGVVEIKEFCPQLLEVLVGVRRGLDGHRVLVELAFGRHGRGKLPLLQLGVGAREHESVVDESVEERGERSRCETEQDDKELGD